MLIVRDDVLPHDLLIGRSLLDREDISFARIGNKFHVCYAEDNPFANMECERNSVNFVRAQTTLANDGSVIIEGKEGCCDSLEMKDSETVDPIINMGNENVILKGNQCVGRVVELDTNCLVNEESCYVNVIKENKRLTEKSEIRVDEETPIENKSEILELVNEVRYCFAMKLSELGCTILTKIERIVSRLTNAPTEFQRLIYHVLGPLLNIKALMEKKFVLEVYQTMSVDEQVLIQRGDPNLDKTISIFTKRKLERHKNWDLRMKELDRNLNNALNKATNKNPFQMLHGYSPRLNDGILRKQADESAEGRTDPVEIQTSSHERKERMCGKKMKDAYNKKRCGTTIYKSRQVVVRKRTPTPTEELTKTQPKYRGNN
ncbi:retrovirus-related Pol polyprotein from transposon 412 [Caerostris extrusa]|uniref:Retrovirus-related Pol polyprotein from transposon 412 n=1 Tax=Caerostris extrusa TaxID=172846 RepID=A0AAV4V5D2_CAEEX|nr:retrovirus-related Pol polyprotein from transposon 412 [Caerostris extrusa]